MAILYPNLGVRHDEVLDGEADEAIEAYKFAAYSSGDGDNIELPQTSGDPVAGVTIAGNTTVGARQAFVKRGIAYVELGATIAAGVKVMGNTAGVAIAATTTLHVAGTLLTGGVSGDLAAIDLAGAPTVLD